MSSGQNCDNRFLLRYPQAYSLGLSSGAYFGRCSMCRRRCDATNCCTLLPRWAGRLSQIKTIGSHQRHNNPRRNSTKSSCLNEAGSNSQHQSTRRRFGETLQAPISESFFQLRSRRFKTGVCPRGAQVFCTNGVKETPDSSTNISRAPSRATFFYSWPVLDDPSGDGRFVPFDGFELRLLAGESQRLEHIRKSVDMVLNAVASSDDFQNSRTGPQVGLEAFRAGAIKQAFSQSFALSRGELARLAGMWFGGQSPLAPLFVNLPPVSDRSLRGTDTPGDFSNRKFFIQQRHGLPPPPFQLIRASMRSHKPLFTMFPHSGK